MPRHAPYAKKRGNQRGRWYANGVTRKMRNAAGALFAKRYQRARSKRAKRVRHTRPRVMLKQATAVRRALRP